MQLLLPIAGLVFLVVFLFLRSIVDRDYSGGLGESPLYSRDLSGSMTGTLLMMRKLFRKKGKGKGKGGSSKKGVGGSDALSGPSLSPAERQYYARESWKVKQQQLAERRKQEIRDSRLDVEVD